MKAYSFRLSVFGKLPRNYLCFLLGLLKTLEFHELRSTFYENPFFLIFLFSVDFQEILGVFLGSSENSRLPKPRKSSAHEDGRLPREEIEKSLVS